MGSSIMGPVLHLTRFTLDRYISYLVGRCGCSAMCGFQNGSFLYLQEIRATFIS